MSSKDTLALKIDERFLEKLRVFNVMQTYVALSTENSSYLFGHMVVVNVPLLAILKRTNTYGAQILLAFQHVIKRLKRHTVITTQMSAYFSKLSSFRIVSLPLSSPRLLFSLLLWRPFSIRFKLPSTSHA